MFIVGSILKNILFLCLVPEGKGKAPASEPSPEATSEPETGN